MHVKQLTFKLETNMQTSLSYSAGDSPSLRDLSSPLLLSRDNSCDDQDLLQDLLLPTFVSTFPQSLDANFVDTSSSPAEILGVLQKSPAKLPTKSSNKSVKDADNDQEKALVKDSDKTLEKALVKDSDKTLEKDSEKHLKPSKPPNVEKKLVQLERKDVAKFRDKILAEQQFKCGICEMTLQKSQAVLDHLHKRRKSDIPGVNDAGLVRGVLCDGCNRIEGKVAKSAMRFQKDAVPGVPTLLRKMADYLEREKHLLIHPTEKLVARKPSKLQYNKLAKIVASKPIPPTLPAFNPRKVSTALQKLFDAFNVDPYATKQTPKSTSTTTTSDNLTTLPTKRKVVSKSKTKQTRPAITPTTTTTPTTSTTSTTTKSTPKRKAYFGFQRFKKRTKK